MNAAIFTMLKWEKELERRTRNRSRAKAGVSRKERQPAGKADEHLKSECPRQPERDTASAAKPCAAWRT